MKVPDTVIKIKEIELRDFIDVVQTIINNGLMEMRIFTAIPTWTANDGETGIYVNGAIRQLYFYLNGVWASIGFSSTGSLQLFDANGDTGITPEYSPNEDVIRFYTFGQYNFSMSTAGFAVAPGLPVMFNGVTGGTQWVYDTSDNYLKGYVDGIKRMEM